MKHLERRYGASQLHFITCSCYRRAPLLGTPRARDCFPEKLAAEQPPILYDRRNGFCALNPEWKPSEFRKNPKL